VHKSELINKHYRENYDRLIKKTTYRVPNRSKHLAEECVQEAYARALKYFKTFNPKQDVFEKWFEGVLRNSVNDCRSIEKDRGVSKELSDEDGADLTPFKKERTMAAVVLRDMKDDVNKQVLNMFLVLGFKTKDISEYTGITHTNVRQVIYRFRSNMNEFLTKNYL
jgi:RNA polymerase sigma factor (sigma-70 family)